MSISWKATRNTAAFIVVMIAGFPTLAAASDTISPQQARNTVAAAQRDLDALIVKFPRIAEIDTTIRRECAAKDRTATSDSGFCHCASAITVNLWLSGIDPKMVPRIEDFLRNPRASADSLLAYQGPELYTPICSLASRT